MSFANHRKAKICLYVHRMFVCVNESYCHLFLCKKTAALMANKEGFVIIIIAFLIHLFIVLDVPNWWINNLYFYLLADGTTSNVSIGVSLLLFPLFGLIADVYLTRYRMLQLSLLMLVLILVVALTGGIIAIPVVEFSNHWPSYFKILPISIVAVGAITSIGIFEANAIQFGMDQLLEASSSQLSTFVHWYFWAINVGQPLVFVAVVIVTLSVGLIFSVPDLDQMSVQQLPEITLAMVITLLWMSSLAMSSLFFHRKKEQMYVAKVGINPFRLICNVLNFARKNKYPLNRSAFTYCEENTPSRLDLGKEQYGGPFTTEEVEDVKTFFRLILLLLSLFGYHISGDGFLVAYFMQRRSCPSSRFLGFIVINPAFLSSLVILLVIPIIKCLPKIHRLIPNMLKRIGIGLSILITQEIIYIALLASPVTTEAIEDPIHGFGQFYTLYCMTYSDHKSQDETLFVSNEFLWLIVPQLLNGLGQLFVHMTIVEFICAQAPRVMQGLLIGLWYAMFSIRYILMSSLDHAFSSQHGMLIYQATRTGLMLFSLLIYLYMSRSYQYRIRDWIVNVQWMVEDVFHRRIKQEECYWRDQMADQQVLFESSSGSDIDELDHLLS